jgi:hypothetical protein
LQPRSVASRPRSVAFATSVSRLATSVSRLATEERRLATSVSRLATEEGRLATSVSRLATEERRLATSVSRLATSVSRLATEERRRSTPVRASASSETATRRLGNAAPTGDDPPRSEDRCPCDEEIALRSRRSTRRTWVSGPASSRRRTRHERRRRGSVESALAFLWPSRVRKVRTSVPDGSRWTAKLSRSALGVTGLSVRGARDASCSGVWTPLSAILERRASPPAAGSGARLAESRRPGLDARRWAWMRGGGYLELTQDHGFDSASRASAVVGGSMVDGRQVWVQADGASDASWETKNADGAAEAEDASVVDVIDRPK